MAVYLLQETNVLHTNVIYDKTNNFTRLEISNQRCTCNGDLETAASIMTQLCIHKSVMASASVM